MHTGLQECKMYKAYQTEYVSTLSLLSRNLAEQCLLNSKLKHSRSNFVLKIRNNLFSKCSIQFKQLYLPNMPIHVKEKVQYNQQIGIQNLPTDGEFTKKI